MCVRRRMTTTPPLLRPVTGAPNAPVRPVQLAAAAAAHETEEQAAKRTLSPVRGDNDAPKAPVRPVPLAAAAAHETEGRAAKRKLSPVCGGDNDASAAEGERGNTCEGGGRVSLV